MTTILLARHGQASFGQANYDQLSDLGSKQAQLLGQHYGHTQRRIDAVFSGTLVRQQDSARHFWQAYQSSLSTSRSSDMTISPLEHQTWPLFDEFNHKDVFIKSQPSFSNQAAIATEIAKADVPKKRLAVLFDEAMQRWHSGEYDGDYVESWSQFSLRAQKALDQVCAYAVAVENDDNNNSDSHADSTIVVFTSGGVIAAITAHLLQQGSQTAYQINKSLVNTGVTAISLRQKTPSLLSLNEYSHLFTDGERFLTWR